jgi:hypothetical protein
VKRILVAACVAVLALFVTGCCEEPGSARVEATNPETQAKQEYAHEVVVGILYIRDPRTNLCFATQWLGGGRREQGLATVPCEAIPPPLLIVAK